MNTPTFCAELTYHAVSYVVPMVVEQTSRGERGYDIFSLLSKNRIVFVGTPIDDSVANLIVAQLLYLAQDDPDHEIQVHINAPVVRWMPGWPSTTPCTWSSPRSQPRASGWVQAGAHAITSITPAGLHLVEPV